MDLIENWGNKTTREPHEIIIYISTIEWAVNLLTLAIAQTIMPHTHEHTNWVNSTWKNIKYIKQPATSDKIMDKQHVATCCIFGSPTALLELKTFIWRSTYPHEQHPVAISRVPAQQVQSDQDWFWPALLSRSVHLDPFSTSFISKPSSATIPIQHLDCPFSTPHLLKSAYQSPTIPP